MIKRVLLCLLAVSALISSGCLFSRKSGKSKENTALATETEKEFRVRWIARRVSELAPQGVTGAAAQQQAEQEFHDKYKFAEPAKK